MNCPKMLSLYEKYKTEWMVEHRISFAELARELDDFRTRKEQDGYEFNSITEVLEEWEADERTSGYFGGVYDSYEVWEEYTFYEELCDRLRDKAHVDFADDYTKVIFYTAIINHDEIVLEIDENHDDWAELIAEFILYGDYAVNEQDATETVRSNIIEWLWLNDEKGGAY